MGYYTTYEISFEGGSRTIPVSAREAADLARQAARGDLTEDELEAKLTKTIPLEWEELMERIRDVSGYDHFEDCKWYAHEENLREVSEEFNDALIIVRGEGEESGDIWIKYFKNGKMQKCMGEIVFPEFDEEKLE